MQLSLSIPKCHILTINGKNSFPFTIQGERISDTDEALDLGIIVDGKLQFSKHCIEKVRKASSILHFLFTCFQTRKTKFLIRMYQTFVVPILDYGAIIYHPHSAKNIRLVESVQRYFTRRLFPSDRLLNYQERLSILNLESLEFRRIKMDLIATYRILYGLTDLNFNKLFKFAPTVGTRSNGFKLAVEFCRTEVKKKFFSKRVVRIWNTLPAAVVTAPTVDQFKQLLETEAIKALLRPFCKYY